MLLEGRKVFGKGIDICNYSLRQMINIQFPVVEFVCFHNNLQKYPPTSYLLPLTSYNLSPTSYLHHLYSSHDLMARSLGLMVQKAVMKAAARRLLVSRGMFRSTAVRRIL